MARYNPLDDTDAQELMESITDHNVKFNGFRQQRLDVLKQVVGAHYSEHGSRRRVPVSFIELALFIHQRQLISGTPQVLITTPHRELKRTAKLMELSVNKQAKAMRLKSTIEMWAMEALICLGVVKHGLAQTGAVEIDGVMHAVGQPYVDVVDLDNYVHDLNAHHIMECDFIADKTRLPYDEVMQSGLYRKSVRDKLQPTEYHTVSETGVERSEILSRGPTGGTGGDYRKYVDLWNVYLPREGLTIVLPVDGPTRTLGVMEWEGPVMGPYVYLAFAPVPSNTMPLPPVASWYDLHMLANSLFRKLGRQAKRQKINYLSRGGQTEDAENLRDAKDGQIVGVNDPGSLVPARYPGADQGNFAFFTQLARWFSYFAGNIDVMGGLGPQAETLGQEQMLGMNSSQRLRAMREILTDSTEDVMTALTWYKWTDPLDEVSVTQRVPGTDIEIPVRFSPEDKLGEFINYNLNIEPYSMHRKTPEERLKTLEYVLDQFVYPAAENIRAQGGQIDYEVIMEKVARYTHMDDFKEIVRFLGMEDEIGVIGQKPGSKPTETTRNYTRTNKSGTTRAGQDGVLSQQLFEGTKPQPAEAAKLVGF